MMQRRRATEQDFEALFTAHREAFRVHIETLWGQWDDSWQRDNFRRECAESICEVIFAVGALVGFVQYADEHDCVRLWNFVLAPQSRGQGIGTQVLRELQGHARRRNVELRLRVFPTNERAQRFYLRLGFRELSRTPTAIELSWSPAP
jgi:ribosomal protein S18 acetylase RimI-like enzyme